MYILDSNPTAATNVEDTLAEQITSRGEKPGLLVAEFTLFTVCPV